VSDSLLFQQKFDGRRLAVQKADGKYSGINKLGQIIPVDARLPSISTDRFASGCSLQCGPFQERRP
jgi:hypothetical protein